MGTSIVPLCSSTKSRCATNEAICPAATAPSPGCISIGVSAKSPAEHCIAVEDGRTAVGGYSDGWNTAQPTHSNRDRNRRDSSNDHPGKQLGTTSPAAAPACGAVAKSTPAPACL